MSFEIITDSAANLSRKIAEKYNITVIPLPYYSNGVECACVDVDDFDDEKYYESLKNGLTVTTSQIIPQRYIEYMEPILKDGKDILFLGISSGISGAFASAQIAREELISLYPERKICLVDTLGASLGEGLLVLRAAKCRENGMELEETAERLEKIRKCIYQVFITDDLAYLRRSGRLSNLSAVIGTVLGIRPLLKGDSQGKIVAMGKIRGKKQSIEAMAQKLFSLGKKVQTIGISYAGCLKDAQYLIDLIKSKFSPSNILLVKHEPATGSYLGPGALALYFEGDDNVREL